MMKIFSCFTSVFLLLQKKCIRKCKYKCYKVKTVPANRKDEDVLKHETLAQFKSKHTPIPQPSNIRQ